ncbi:MAG: hypothetical protein COX40_01150 [Candidatus Omnitrophica bacterium CG23_combo_of_CG06-09_8_20_14_all_40_11]|nr:MAG: hypothetical protein COX40_01150 [Candidatus Omnitrophica bacterium CG23_combo_of_CG06-09_8_20_14_all_40_11]PIV39889.1 MAG: hypothetical protein COS29_00160 [Candidatus Omnitrophica bacterium CG02_land_8_20_14_3_00__42_8]
MGYRILDVKVAKVDPERNKLVIKRKKVRAGKIKYLKNSFIVDASTLITANDNRTITLSEIKVGNRITIDFLKTKDKKLLAKGISVLKLRDINILLKRPETTK